MLTREFEEYQKRVEINRTKYPNPNPKNFKIVKAVKVKKFLLLLVNYPDCTNYEGNKILVYKNTTLKDIDKQKSLDPHFSNNCRFISPIARFEPTIEGWDMADSFCRNYNL
jgi:hypothetical protein